MKTIKQMLVDHFEFYSMNASVNQINLWADQLSGISLSDLYSAMQKSWSDGSNTRPIMPAKIIEIVYGIIPANEAWAKVEKITNDESAAIIWSEEMRMAWSDAYSLIRANDLVAARMTFLESYRNRVSSLIAERKYPKYVLSHGSKENNKAALLQAIASKQMTPDRALLYEPELEIPKSLINSLQLEHTERLQIEHKIQEMESNPENKDKINSMIKDFFDKQKLKKEQDLLKREEERKAEVKRISDLKEEQLKRLEQEK